MRVLDIFTLLGRLFLLDDILVTVDLSDIILTCSVGLIGYSCRVRTQICDKTDGSVAFDIHTFV